MNPNRIPVALALAAIIIGASLFAAFAQNRDWLSDEFATRVPQILSGLVLAMFANVAPKEIGRLRSMRSARRAQSVARTAGWLLTLAGLGYSAIWAFVPLGPASVASIALVGSALLATLAYAGWSHVQCRREDGHPEASQ